MEGASNSRSILFIGNSFSYYHDLPKLIARLVRASRSGNLLADGVFKGGATLKMLWSDGKALKKLHSQHWDYVALQERGRLGGIVKRGIVHVGRPQSFFTYATRFDKEIRAVGAKTVFYCPPAFLGAGLSRDAKRLHAAHATLARKLHAILIPAGTAFALALKERPHLNLYERDKQHPNPLGTYLVAALFYAELFRKRVSNLPLESYRSKSARLSKSPKTIKLSRRDVRFLWSVAKRIS